MKVKEQRDYKTNELTGYIINDITFVPLERGNRHYQEVQEWIAEGNTPEPAFTEKERLEHLKNKKKEKIVLQYKQKIREIGDIEDIIAEIDTHKEKLKQYKQIKDNKLKEINQCKTLEDLGKIDDLVSFE